MSCADGAERAGDIPVALHTHVEVELVDESGGAERLAFDLVADAQADFARGLLAVGAPLARAILGHRAGDEVAYRAGDIFRVRIVRVAPAAAAPPADMTAQRQAIIQQAVARAEVINDAVFALSAGSKWGSYDPELTADERKASARKGKRARNRRP